MQDTGHRSPRSVSFSASLARAARVLVACALLVPAGCGGEADPCEDLAAELEARLADEDRPGGTVAAVITPDCGLWTAAAGTAGDGKPLTCEHLVRAGSVTKTYVSATILSLVTGGSFGLDDTLDNWVPEFPDAERITVRQLLDHTSGIFDYTSDEDFLAQILADPTRAYSPAELVAVATAHPPYFAPGEDWYYSNTNYILLGMIIEAETGEPAAAAIRSRLLDPLSLQHTFLDGDEPMQGALAHGFDRNGEDVTFALHPSAAWTAGAVAATAGDLAEWALALYGGDVVAPALRDDMLDLIDVSQLIPGASYGLGVTVFDASVVGTPLIGHGGAIPGFFSEMYYLPDHDSVIVVAVTSEEADPLATLGALAERITAPRPRR
jgi:D-alanyl-D-alanine carboxypeptidase